MDKSAESDLRLVERVKQGGDEEAFRLLYRRHTPRLFRFLLRYTGGRASDAEDALQESWIRAVRGFARLRDGNQVYSWLRSTAVHVISEMARRDQRRERLAAGRIQVQAADAELRPVEVTAEQRGPPREDVLDLENAIAALSEEHRRVLVLHDIEGYTHMEIAVLLDIAEGTSKSQLFAARRQVRALLLRDEIEEEEDVTSR